DQVAESFLARLRTGQRPAVSEYQRKYPELADDIAELFPALVMMEEGRKCVQQQPAAHPACLTDEQMPERLGEYRLVRPGGRGRHGGCLRSLAGFAEPARGFESPALQ